VREGAALSAALLPESLPELDARHEPLKLVLNLRLRHPSYLPIVHSAFVVYARMMRQATAASFTIRKFAK
jgi:hypothetical protein